MAQKHQSFKADSWESDTGHTCAPVSWHREGASSRALRLPVTLEDQTAQSGSEEGQHRGGDGS